MTQEEIILTFLKLRGTTLCLGESLDVELEMFGIPKSNISPDMERLICIPSDHFLQNDSFKVYINGKKWDVFFFVSNYISNKIIAYTSTSTFLEDIKSREPGESKNTNNSFSQNDNNPFYKCVQDLCVTNIWMIDTFPFHTKELDNNIKRIHSMSQASHLEFGVALLTGLRKYGSTDISTEPEAVKKERSQLSKRGVACIEINQSINPNQILDFFSPPSRQFEVATEIFKSDCQTTLDNLEMSKDILGSIFLIGVNMSLKEYMAHIKNTMTLWTPMFPIVKYLNNSFYQNFENAICIKFNYKKASDTMALSNKFADAFYHALKNWIIQICKYKK